MLRLWLVEFETPHEGFQFVIRSSKQPTDMDIKKFVYANFATANVQGVSFIKETNEKEIREGIVKRCSNNPYGDRGTHKMIVGDER